jgi:amino acid transporter/mannitol/fructose-specific phosphotransferase system IIA component (Ntr-type)
MSGLAPTRRLKKELGLFQVYAIATGTTLSAGLFLLPGLAAEEIGTSLVLAYLLAAVPLIPAMFSIIELATAMPRAGGVYYFLDRSLGPVLGAVGGIGTWFALMLKVSFALIGMGAYVRLFVPGLEIRPVAVTIAVLLGIVALSGAKKTGTFQVWLVVALLTILGVFLGGGIPQLELADLRGVFGADWHTLVGTAGLVYISYVGVTNVASLSEEVEKPHRNLPLGVSLALVTAIAIYALATMVMVGVVPLDRLQGDLTPMATAAEYIFGRWGVILLSVAALLAFVSVANAGTLSSSRYPLAMSRDELMPKWMQRLDDRQTPKAAIVLTVGLIVLILLVLNPLKIAKLASAFQLIMFALVCLAVVVMRESQIEEYDPGFRSPLYPWMQILGIAAPFVFLAQMDRFTGLFSIGLIAVSLGWYWYYARGKLSRSGALYHLLLRLAEPRVDTGLEVELGHILREKGVREEDPFDEVVTQATVLEFNQSGGTFEDLVAAVAEMLDVFLPATAEELEKGFLSITRLGATSISNGVSLLELSLFDIEKPFLVMARARRGVNVEVTDVHGVRGPESLVYCLLFLVSPEADPKQHLRILAQIAEHADTGEFLSSWRKAPNEQVLKELLLHDDRLLTVRLRRQTSAETLIGQQLKDLPLPDSVLVALIRRDGQIMVPRGRFELREGDRLTILGEPADIERLHDEYSG